MTEPPAPPLSGRRPTGAIGVQTGAAIAAVLLVSGGAEPRSGAFDPTPSAQEPRLNADPFAAELAQSATRFDLPERLLRAVMSVESNGDPNAVSPAGAMGLMQIMPATWDEVSARYGLGDDAFDPRANVLGGAAYLHELIDRFGLPGALAAYNAGPERYRAHVEDGRPLPPETRAYLARLAPRIALIASDRARLEELSEGADWRAAPLFVTRSGQTGEEARGLFARRSAEGDGR